MATKTPTASPPAFVEMVFFASMSRRSTSTFATKPLAKRPVEWLVKYVDAVSLRDAKSSAYPPKMLTPLLRLSAVDSV